LGLNLKTIENSGVKTEFSPLPFVSSKQLKAVDRQSKKLTTKSVLTAVKQRADNNKARKTRTVGQKTRNTYFYSDIESNNMIRTKTKFKKSRPLGKEHPQTPMGLILQEKNDLNIKCSYVKNS
jgi:hypothetical protein